MTSVTSCVYVCMDEAILHREEKLYTLAYAL